MKKKKKKKKKLHHSSHIRLIRRPVRVELVLLTLGTIAAMSKL
jgi:hypothetical protein